jgi:hypothetical protein
MRKLSLLHVQTTRMVDNWDAGRSVRARMTLSAIPDYAAMPRFCSSSISASKCSSLFRDYQTAADGRCFRPKSLVCGASVSASAAIRPMMQTTSVGIGTFPLSQQRAVT